MLKAGSTCPIPLMGDRGMGTALLSPAASGTADTEDLFFSGRRALPTGCACARWLVGALEVRVCGSAGLQHGGGPRGQSGCPQPAPARAEHVPPGRAESGSSPSHPHPSLCPK